MGERIRSERLTRRGFVGAMTASAVAVASAPRSRAASVGRPLVFLPSGGLDWCGAPSLSPGGDRIVFAGGSATRQDLYASVFDPVDPVGSFSPSLILTNGAPGETCEVGATAVSSDCNRVGFWRLLRHAAGYSEQFVELTAVGGDFCAGVPSMTSIVATTLDVGSGGTLTKAPAFPLCIQKGNAALALTVAGTEVRFFNGPKAGVDTIALATGTIVARDPVDLGSLAGGGSGTAHIEFACCQEVEPNKTVVYSVSQAVTLCAGPSGVVETDGLDVLSSCAGHGYVAYVLTNAETGSQVLVLLDSSGDEIDTLRLPVTTAYLRPDAILPDGRVVLTVVTPDLAAPQSSLAIW